MDYWLTDPEGAKLARLIVGHEHLQVMSDDDLLRKATAWLSRRRQSEWWHGCISMGSFLHEFSLSAENHSLPVQVRFL